MVAPLLEPEPLGAVAPAWKLDDRRLGVKSAAHKSYLARPCRVLMGLVVAGAAQAGKVVEPVGIRAAPARDVMHFGHRFGAAMFADAATSFVDLLAALRIDRVAFSAP